jgi:hypothetical protein
MRGAGTSIGGQAVGPGVVLDCSRYLDRVLEVNPGRRTARVEPGRTAESVVDLDVLLVDGTQMTVGATPQTEADRLVAAGGRRGELYAALRGLAAGGAGAICAEFGVFRGGCPATRWSSCCRSTASTWRDRWSAAKAPARWCWAPPCRWSGCSGTAPCWWPALGTCAAPRMRSRRSWSTSPFAVEGIDDQLVAMAARRAAWLYVDLAGQSAAETTTRA